jgi:hypothetical protein
MSAVGLLLDALGDAEAEVAELTRMRTEVTKLRKLLVVKLCDCRRMASTLPLEPMMHGLHCQYRRAMR